ncbi:MAG: hypothetical protein ABIS50_11445 [Luteolibacter sp.]|uniref:hypothetical protein n=1 Tax=Luteolibacter sp. TaxID=1962973 RepID=UPI0032657DA8
MNETLHNAIRSIRVCAWINIKQAKVAKAAGRSLLANYHAAVALQCRRDANSLRL